MAKNLIAFWLFLSIAFSLQSARLIDPSKLQCRTGIRQQSTGHFRGEKYLDYYYEGRVIFRVLPRFKYAVLNLIEQANELDTHLVFEENPDILFDDESKINRNLSVLTEDRYDEFRWIDQKRSSGIGVRRLMRALSRDERGFVEL